jgi:hypothetical protein
MVPGNGKMETRCMDAGSVTKAGSSTLIVNRPLKHAAASTSRQQKLKGMTGFRDID